MKTYLELGNILLAEVGKDACMLGYGTDEPEWIGRYGVQFGDINLDGTLN
jgi:hypothetical protein